MLTVVSFDIEEPPFWFLLCLHSIIAHRIAPVKIIAGDMKKRLTDVESCGILYRHSTRAARKSEKIWRETRPGGKKGLDRTA